ncbi:MAG: class I SAM-dependent methyltransferase [Oscillospiraceae bacterium]|nr:class I SAM-dependent methyltransferase [Oscillospiraceae bacterium]
MSMLTPEFFDAAWKDSMPKDGMKHTKETWNMLAKNWRIDSKEVQEKKDKIRVDLVEFLVSNGLLKEGDSVIDIGCGMGEYSRAFAKIADSVVATDISTVMLGYARGLSESVGINNIEFEENDFLAFDNSITKWFNRFNLVFTSLTPAMSGLESVKRVSSMSKEWCFNNSFIYRDDSIRNILMSEVFDMPINRNWGNSSPICLFNILWCLGYYPKMEYYKETIDSEHELTETFAKNCVENIIRDRAPTESEIKMVYDYLESIAIDNKITKSTESLYAWTYWNVNDKKDI